MIHDLKLCDNIYLKPIFRASIEVKITALLKSEFLSKSISNWEIIEKLRKLSPKTLTDVSLKIEKSTTEALSFTADLATRSLLKQTIFNLDKKKLKLNGFTNSLVVEATEIRYEYPLKHDWISHFRDAKGIDENEPGLRPDTVIIHHLPIYWFSSGSEKNQLGEIVPSPDKVRRVFETFGEIRRLDIPMLDPVQNLNLLKSMELERDDMKKELKLIKGTFGNVSKMNESIAKASGLFKFTAYIQYKNILGFTKAIDTLRGSKLLLKPEDPQAPPPDESNMAEIRIDFDRSGHLSTRSVERRTQFIEKIKKLNDKTHTERMKRYEAEKEAFEKIKAQEMKEQRILEETQNRLKLECETLRCLEEKKRRQKMAAKECNRERKVLKKQLALYKDFHEDYIFNLNSAECLQRRLGLIIEKVDEKRTELIAMKKENDSAFSKSHKKHKKHKKKSGKRRHRSGESETRESKERTHQNENEVSDDDNELILSSSLDTDVMKKRILIRLENNIREKLIRKKIKLHEESMQRNGKD